MWTLAWGLDIELAESLRARIARHTNTGCIAMGACCQCPDQEEINKAFFNHPNIFFRDNTSRYKKSRLLEHTDDNFLIHLIKMVTHERCSECHIYQQGRTDQGHGSTSQSLSSMK